MKVSACLFVFCLLSCVVLGDWAIVQNHYETIALSTSFVGSTTGWVTGGTATLDPLFLYTTNGGQNFTNEGLSDSSTGAFLSIRMASTKWGVAGGFGLFGTPCGAYTSDGNTWQTMDEAGLSIVCALQGCSAVDDGRTGVLVGVWSHFPDLNGDGVKITTDGGRRWEQHNSDTGEATCRYGDFMSKDMGYVTAGSFPSTTESNYHPFDFIEGEVNKFHLSQYVHLNALTGRYEVNTNKAKEAAAATDGYSGLILAVTNEGRDWKTLVNITNEGFYFNEISCADQNNCWAVTEGVDATGGIGSVYHTADGWNTYDVQFNVTGGALTAIEMVSATEGWMAGALVSGPDVTGDFDGQFWYTQDGGQTWTLDSEIKNSSLWIFLFLIQPMRMLLD